MSPGGMGTARAAAKAAKRAASCRGEWLKGAFPLDPSKVGIYTPEI